MVVYRTIGIVVISALMACCGKVQNDSEVNDVNRDSIDFSCVERGDLLFRRGRSLSSNIVLYADTSGNYSHVGIAVKYNGRVAVAHAAPTDNNIELVKIESLEEFFEKSKAERGAVCRFDIDTLQLDSINLRAIEIVESNTPFDNSYNTEDQSKLYCTEYIWEVYKVIGYDISQGKRTTLNLGFTNGEIILPSHLYSNDMLEIVMEF